MRVKRGTWPSYLVASVGLVTVTIFLAGCSDQGVAEPPTGFSASTGTSDDDFVEPSSGRDLASLAQPAGQQRVLDASDKGSYWPLMMYFETQETQTYCAVASSVMALNAVGVPRPSNSKYPDYPFFTQDQFFDSVDPGVATPDQVRREGMTFDQLATVLESSFPVAVSRHRAMDVTEDAFRSALQDAVRSSDKVAMLNFDRTRIGQAGGGHWSPLAAYDASTDTALLLDVARYRYAPVWVPVADLYQAARSVDSTSGQSRGILTVTPR
ncbi:phytochelatin synthase family protein [Rhodococcus cerastii]|nr:phytochelatin synthase family protein [Rhodococcus cerastii]